MKIVERVPLFRYSDEKADPDNGLSVRKLVFFPLARAKLPPVFEVAQIVRAGRPHCRHLFRPDSIAWYAESAAPGRPCPRCLDAAPVSRFRSGDNDDGGSKKRKKPEFDPSWERENTRFTVEDSSLEDILAEELERLAHFCEASGLTSTAMVDFEKVRAGSASLLLATNESTNEVVAFAVFSRNWLGVRLRGMLRDHFRDERWLPEDPKFTEDWLDVIEGEVEWLNEEGKDQTYEDPDDVPPELVLDIAFDLKGILPSREGHLMDQVGEIAKWLAVFDWNEPDEPDSAVIDLHLICADPDAAGMGILKGVLRWLQNDVVEYAGGRKLSGATIFLTAVNQAKISMYKLHGFKHRSGRPSEFDLTSGNLLQRELEVGRT